MQVKICWWPFVWVHAVTQDLRIDPVELLVL